VVMITSNGEENVANPNQTDGLQKVDYYRKITFSMVSFRRDLSQKLRNNFSESLQKLMRRYSTLIRKTFR
jgi:hypothetical protein